MPFDFDKPCGDCVAGKHDRCTSALCGCIAPHESDSPTMRGFKHIKRRQHPERESWTAGGWK